MNGGLRLLDPHAHMHCPWKASELCKRQRISWTAHRAWLVSPRGGGSLGWQCSSSVAANSFPPSYQRQSSAPGCEHPLSADFRGEQLCAFLMAPEALLTAVLWWMLLPELPLPWVFDGFAFCSFLFFSYPMHKSCQLQPNCILFRQTVSGAMQMSFEMWRSGLYLSVNCQSNTDI